MTITSILCLCLAALFIWTEKKENYMGAVILKGLASLCFVFVGVMAGNGGQGFLCFSAVMWCTLPRSCQWRTTGPSALWSASF